MHTYLKRFRMLLFLHFIFLFAIGASAEMVDTDAILMKEDLRGQPSIALTAPAFVGPGDTFNVQLILQDNPGVWDPTVEIFYEAERFELLSVINGELYADNELTTPNYARNPIIISYIQQDLADRSYNGILATLTFSVKTDASLGDASIRIAGYDIVSAATEEELSFTTVDAAVTVHIHDYGEWKIVREATPNTPGERVRTCQSCGNAEHETIPMCRLGDVDSDGSITIKDALLTLKAVLNGADLNPIMDINGDENVSLADVILIMRLAAAGQRIA